MTPSYRRDKDHNYMILEAKEEVCGSEYQVRMLLSNEIPGLLPCNMRIVDGRPGFYYEITSKQPLSRIFEKSAMGKEDIQKLLLGIRRGMENIKRFLLDEHDILLEPEYIYMDVESRQVYLCCLPFYQGELTREFTQLAEYILKKLDHSDKQAVLWGYEIYSKTMEENYSMEKVLESVYQEEVREETEKKKEEAAVRAENRERAGEIRKEECEEGSWERKIPEKRIQEKRIPEKRVQEKRILGKRISGKRAPEKRIQEKRIPEKRAQEKKIQKKKISSEALRGQKKTELEILNSQKKKEEAKIKYKPILYGALAFLAVLLLSYGLKWNVTQAGGAAFLLAALVMYGASMKKKPKKEKEPPLPREDEVFYCQEEGWEEETGEKEPKEERKEEFLRRIPWQQEPEGAGFQRGRQEPEEREEYGQTTVLREELTAECPVLISEEPEKEPHILLDKKSVLIGKMKEKTDAVLREPSVSRIHAKVEKKKDGFYITDLNSTNGTFLNGERLNGNECRRVEKGDQIYFAAAGYRFRG